MKKLFYFLFISTVLISCKEKELKTKANNLTKINLIFTDYKANKHKNFIKIKIENGINSIEEQLKISNSGTVSYNFISHKKRELILNYENREFSLISSPNEELTVQLTIEGLTNWKSKFKGFEVTTGTNKTTNNLILVYTSYLDSLINQAPNGFSNDGRTHDIDYKDIRMKEMNRQLNELNKLIVKNKIADQTFINWGQAQIRYRAGNDLSIYPFFGIVNKDIDDENSYFDFIDEISLINNEIVFQSYLDYLSTLSTSYKIISKIADKYSNEREQLKKDSISNFPIVFSIIKKRPKNEERELLMAYAFNENKDVPKNYLDSLQNYVNNHLLAQINTKEIQKTENLISLLKQYEIEDSEKNELLKLYKGTKGKVIFHDFWFTNCAPCMKELPNYNALISSLNKEKVEFIFYGAYMDKEEWKKTVDSLKIKGKHHLLTKNQLAFFERYFSLYGFPHHQLINSNGTIGEKSNHGIYPTNFEKIKKMIEKHHLISNN